MELYGNVKRFALVGRGMSLGDSFEVSKNSYRQQDLYLCLMAVFQDGEALS